MVAMEGQGGGNRARLVKRYRLPAVRRLRSEDLMHSRVRTVGQIEICYRIEFKFYSHKV